MNIKVDKNHMEMHTKMDKNIIKFCKENKQLHAVYRSIYKRRINININKNK